MFAASETIYLIFEYSHVLLIFDVMQWFILIAAFSSAWVCCSRL